MRKSKGISVFTKLHFLKSSSHFISRAKRTFIFILGSVLLLCSPCLATFFYDPITEPITSARFSGDFAALVAHRSVFGHEVNFAKLYDLSGSLGVYDLSDDLFGTAAYPDTPKLDMGALETGIVSADIDSSFFPALAEGSIGLEFLFTDTDDSMFAIDFVSLTIETDTTTVESLYGWPIGNENNGFGIGLADGADLPSPLPTSIPTGATDTGYDETLGSKRHDVPEPVSLLLLGGGVLGLFLRRDRSKRKSAAKNNESSYLRIVSAITILIMVGWTQPALGVTITDINLYQMDINEVNLPPAYDTNCGDLRFTLLPDDDPNIYYLNLTIRRELEQPEYWVIQNMGLHAGTDINEPFTIARFFSLADIVTEGIPIATFDYHIHLSADTLQSPPAPDTFVTTTVLDGLFDVTPGADSSEFEEELDEPNTVPAATQTVSAGSPPAVPSPKRKIRTDVPEVGEKPGECVSASIARSLLWLHKRKKINLGNEDDPNSLTKPENLKRKLSDLLGIKPKTPDVLKAKLAMAKDLDLLIRFASPSPKPRRSFRSSGKTAYRRGIWPEFKFIRRMIRVGEDVEIKVVWYAPGARRPARVSGHVLTVIGFVEDKAGNLKQIVVQDDENQRDNSNKNRRRHGDYYNKGETFDDGTNFSPVVRGLHPRYVARVHWVMAESPKRRIDNLHVFPPVPPPPLESFLVPSTATIKASLQYNFTGVPDMDLEFTKHAGSFTFDNGFVFSDGNTAALFTDDNGNVEAHITAVQPGPALIEVNATESNLSAFLFFDIGPCQFVANLDDDCDVDFIDFAILANQWLQTPGTPSADIAPSPNGDGIVNGLDLKELIDSWLEGK